MGEAEGERGREMGTETRSEEVQGSPTFVGLSRNARRDPKHVSGKEEK